MTIPFKIQLLLISGVTFLMWWFVFRRYRSLGLRLLYLCSMVGLMISFWFYNDLQEQKQMQQNGRKLTAKLTRKWTALNPQNSLENLIEVTFEYPNGQPKVQSSSVFISDQEHAALRIGQPIKILYNPSTEQVYYAVSFARYQSDQWIFYVLIAFFFILGAVLGYCLRNIEVGIHQETGDEYLEKEGKIIFDEKSNDIARTAKRLNIISKLYQTLK
jgi:hypothetical protein